jgi:hypothetical protein
MKYIITESQYDRLMEQSSVCKKNQVAKAVVDSKLKMLSSKVDEISSSVVNRFTKGLDKKYVDMTRALIGKLKTEITSINTKKINANFGLSPKYDSSNDLKLLLDKAYSELESTFDKNFVYKVAASTYVTKSNVGEVKKIMGEIVDKILTGVYQMTLFPNRLLLNDIRDSYPKCSDGGSSVLTFPENIVSNSDNVSKIFHGIRNRVNQKIDSLV